MDSDKKASNAGNIILVFIAMVMGTLIGVMFASHQNRVNADESLQGKVAEVMDLVESEYVDEINADSLGEELLRAMLSQLDPHSLYLSYREAQRTEEQLRGNFDGVGLVLHREGDTTYVGTVMAGGPSDGSGILPGDMIVRVDGVQVSGCGMPADSVVGHLRGPRRSTVTIEVSRMENGKEVPHGYRVRRGVVMQPSLPYSGMIDDTTGYILLSAFTVTSHDEFHEALRQLCSKGMRHLIFDLRGNGGGSLEDAVGIAGELLPAGSHIVYTQGAHQRRHNVYARPGGLFTTGRVTVMVDEESASASEVVSGALQDNDRALIVGRRTFGKGLVQREFVLGDGSSVLLTTARYYTPSGRSIQRPYTDGTDAYYRSYMERLVEESYAEEPTMHVADSTPYYTAGGRVVYGGGGIFPDHLLSYHRDTTLVYYNRLSAKGLVNRTAFAYVRAHAGQLLERFKDAADFNRRFVVDSQLEGELVAAGERSGIPLDRRSLETQRPLVRSMLKAYIGDALFGREAMYPELMKHDEDLKAVRKLKPVALGSKKK